MAVSAQRDDWKRKAKTLQTAFDDMAKELAAERLKVIAFGRAAVPQCGLLMTAPRVGATAENVQRYAADVVEVFSETDATIKKRVFLAGVVDVQRRELVPAPVVPSARSPSRSGNQFGSSHPSSHSQLVMFSRTTGADRVTLGEIPPDGSPTIALRIP